MEILTTFLLSTVVALLIHLWRIGKKAHRFWDEYNVTVRPPTPFLGSSSPLVTQKQSQMEFYAQIYREHPEERVVAFYEFLTPLLMIRDPLLVERVCIKDFSHFTDRGFEDVLNELHPVDKGLFLMRGPRWRAMRVKLTPVFTSAKIKTMFQLAKGPARNLADKLASSGSDGEDFRVRDLSTVFACDLVATCVFGLDIGSQLNPDSEFVDKARRVFSMSPLRLLKFFLTVNFQWTKRFIGISMTAPDVADYFYGLLQGVLRERRTNPLERNDFINLLLGLREKGTLKVQLTDPEDRFLDMGEDFTPAEYEEEITDDSIIAQAYAFLSAGFDTTAVLMEFLLYELSKNPKVQEKARQEVLSLIEQNGGELSYQTLAKMVYLEQCVKEALRLHPPGDHIFRECAKEYTFDDGLVIKPGQRLVIPIAGVMTDPKYFPDPCSYLPERFDQEPLHGTFLPFGAGPRMCIGMRFAMINVKLGLATILRTVKIEPSSKTVEPLLSDPHTLVSSPKNRVWCRLTKL